MLLKQQQQLKDRMKAVPAHSGEGLHAPAGIGSLSMTNVPILDKQGKMYWTGSLFATFLNYKREADTNDKRPEISTYDNEKGRIWKPEVFSLKLNLFQ